MITLTHPSIPSRLVLSQDMPAVLTVENAKVFTALVQDLLAQSDNEPGGFVLMDELKPLTISREVQLILSPFALDFEQRKIMTKIAADLNQLSMQPEHYESTASLQTALQNYLEELEADYSVPLKWDIEISAGNIAKAANIGIMTDGLSLPERILTFMQVATSLKLAKFFVFVQLRPFLSSEQLETFLYEARLKKYCILLLEGHDVPRHGNQERRLTIDDALCETVNDFADLRDT